MKKGRTLELVVASLEKALSGKPGVTIVAPYKVPDKTNQKHTRPREHDVAVIHADGHHRFLIALECRDRSRPITREQVEAFSRKCQDTGIHKGAIVSVKGFRKTAQEKAKFLEIECLSLKEVEGFNWLLPEEFFQFGSKLLKHIWLFIPETDAVPKPQNFTLFDETGNEILPQVLAANVQIALKQKPDLMLKPGVHPVKIRFELNNWHLLDKATGLKHKLKQANTYVEIEVFKEAVPFKKVLYANEETKTQIAEAAIAPIEAGPLSGELMMINKGEGIQILYVPRQKSP